MTQSMPMIRKCPSCNKEWFATSFKIKVDAPGPEGLTWSDIALTCPQDHRFSLVQAVKKKFMSQEEASFTYTKAVQYRTDLDAFVEEKDWESLHELFIEQGLNEEDAAGWVAVLRTKRGES